MSRPPRGRVIFKQKDVVRAMRSAQAAGLAVGGVEVVTRDGTTIRVLGKPEQAESNPWDTVNAENAKRPA